MTDTFPEAISEVYDALDGTVTVDSLLEYEPAGFSIERGSTITLFPDGITPDAWRVQLRVYVSTASSVKDATATIGTVTTAVEEALPGSIPRSSWETAWFENGSALIATTVLDVPREDF